jgi:hypothetical protein
MIAAKVFFGWFVLLVALNRLKQIVARLVLHQSIQNLSTYSADIRHSGTALVSSY